MIREFNAVKPSRPHRNRRIFASRYWNTCGIGIAVVAIYGFLTHWACTSCNAPLNDICEGEKPIACRHCQSETFEVRGDWAAYIGGSPSTAYQEHAENDAAKSGEKLSREDAMYYFGWHVEQIPKLEYRG